MTVETLSSLIFTLTKTSYKAKLIKTKELYISANTILLWSLLDFIGTPISLDPKESV